MKNAFEMYEPVVSRYTKKRGRVVAIEHDEFFHCMMFKVDMSPNVYLVGDKKIPNDGCNFWFKAADLMAAADANHTEAIAS